MIPKYNAKDVTITVNNIYITGVSEDMVNGSRDEEFFDTAVGAKGDIVINEKNNPLGTITLTLQATSPHNALMKKLAMSGEMFSIWVTNKTISEKGEKFGGTQAKIKNFPEIDYGTEAGDREYEIAVLDYTVV